LSFDRLEIAYDEDKFIIISPVDKMKFIQKLGSEKFIATGKRAQPQADGKAAKKSLKRSKTNRKNSQT